jgi:asparagine synthase (glutamine-hydrolysing)
MCGICGILQTSGEPVDVSLLRRMTDAIAHRGPDGEGQLVDGEIALGHRRLSIIDLHGGSQPISNENGRFQVVFNGEIYNFVELRTELEAYGHKFRTRSDTEVIVHAYEQWGADCVRRFNGMFVFAIADSWSRALFIARDHLGIKPLYYAVLHDRILFASEIKALLQDPTCPREVDLQALSELFTLRYVPSPKTLFHGILKLPPGHYMNLSSRGVQIERYWKTVPRARRVWNERELVEEYQDLLEDAVRLQLRSDVPLGLFLSSGVDSGVLLAIMSHYSGDPVNTFTIGFERGEATNEVDDARTLARLFGAKHQFMMVGPEDYLKYYDRYLWDLEEPVGNETAAAFYFVSKITSAHVKVALTGQGADEPWGGYHRHLGAKLSSYYSRCPRAITEPIRAVITRVPGRFERLKRSAAALSEPDVLTRLAKIYSFFSADMRRRLFDVSLQTRLPLDSYHAKEAFRLLQSDVATLDPLTQILYIDTRTNLPDDLLMVGDKMSMANSLEARVPFLDFRLVEFVESLPAKMRLKGTTGKYLHKRAAEKWLPVNLVWRKKKGFANPIEEWFRTCMRPFVEECLLSSDSAAALFFDQKYIKTLLDRDRQGLEQYRRHLYLLVSFELWHRKFIRH